ncbi:MAG: hydrogenase expression protein [SAR202 cluster bacterium]|nr:hydrogenase expression protein [SAR202 cluster bacterium]
MQAGKLPFDLLSRMLGKIEISDPRVVVGARPGVDAAVIYAGDRYLVTKTDPITFATDSIGWYVVQVNANDIAVTGATPKWMMATLLLPEGIEAARVEAIFDQLLAACRDLGITLVGGHTEVTYGLPRPIAVGALLGEVEKHRLVLSSGARAGDSIVVTKGIAIEGSAILAQEAPERLAAAGVSAATIARARGWLQTPGISVVRDCAVALAAGGVRAMHDPTEGGLAGGLSEMAAASGLGAEIDLERVPVFPECAEICRAAGLDPLGLIASGSLLAAVAPTSVDAVTSALAGAGIPAVEIGRFTPAGSGLLARSGGKAAPMPAFARDEIARFFSA